MEKQQPLQSSIKWRIVGYLESGKSQIEASKYFGVSQGCISKIGKRFNETNSVDDKPRTGRPKKIRTLTKNEIKMELEKPFNTSRVIAEKIGISKSAVCTIAKELGFKFQYSDDIPKLTEEHKLKRKQYCEQGKDADLSKIIFSDESYFHIFRNTLGQGTKEKRIVLQINPNKALMVGGAISFDGKSKICINEGGYRINQDSYIEILENYLLPFADEIYEPDEEITFLQDNAPAHRGQKTQHWLKESQISLVGHPPYSPDLNPIEFIGKLLKDSVEKESPQDLSELNAAIKKGWDNINESTIKGVICCLKDRLQKVYENNGEFD